MADPRPHTRAFPATARRTLGLAVTRAREAAGHPKRPSFALASGLSVRSILKLETGDPVGAPVYEAVGRTLGTVLADWSEESPLAILCGEPVPSSRRIAEPNVANDSDPDNEVLDRMAATVDGMLQQIDRLRNELESLRDQRERGNG